MLFHKIYKVKYLFPKESDSCRSVFLSNCSSDPFERRIKYFRNREDAEHFLGLIKCYFKKSLPDYSYLCKSRNFKIKSRIQLKSRWFSK